MRDSGWVDEVVVVVVGVDEELKVDSSVIRWSMNCLLDGRFILWVDFGIWAGSRWVGMCMNDQVEGEVREVREKQYSMNGRVQNKLYD